MAHGQRAFTLLLLLSVASCDSKRVVTVQEPDLPTPGGMDLGADRALPLDRGGGLDARSPVEPERTLMPADRCLDAVEIELVEGEAVVRGSTATLQDTMVINCLEYPYSSKEESTAPDGFYRVTLIGGQAYAITLSTVQLYFAAFYLFPGDVGCEIEGVKEATCGGGEGAISLLTVHLPTSIVIVPEKTRSYTIAIDSIAQEDSYNSYNNAGVFKLRIEALHSPANATCGAAEAVAWDGEAITLTGMTAGAVSGMPDLRCSDTLLGRVQAYYRIPLESGSVYQLRLTSGLRREFFIFGDSCVQEEVAAACGSEGVSGAIARGYAGSTRSLFFSPPTSGAYHVGVSGPRGPSAPFTLQVNRLAPASNDRCADAEEIILSQGGAATVTGNTGAGARDEFPELQCTGSSPLDGPQLYYRVALTAGTTYRVALSPEFKAFHYIFSSVGCEEASIVVDCKSGGATGDAPLLEWGNESREIYFTPQTSGPHVITVDSPDDRGAFTLRVETFAAAVNGACQSAAPITLSGGKAVIEGNTAMIANEFPGLLCGWTDSRLAGSQVYYTLDVEGHKLYEFRLNPTFTASLVLFPSVSACQQELVEAACSTSGGGSVKSFIFPSNSAVLRYQPVADGLLYVSVDGVTPETRGSFQLEVRERATPAGAHCETPQVVELDSAVTTIQGDLALVPADDLEAHCGLLPISGGGQLYYKVLLMEGQTYTFRVSPTFDAMIYAFPAATPCELEQINEACTSPTPLHPDNITVGNSELPEQSGGCGCGGSVLPGFGWPPVVDLPETEEEVRITPAITGESIIVVRSVVQDAGLFELEILSSAR